MAADGGGTVSDRDLLSVNGIRLLEHLAKVQPRASDRDQIVTPQDAGRRLDVSWQKVVRIAGPLERMGLIRVKRMGKMTIYRITPSGLACVTENLPG
jgi:Mn-dependent DtxR family transcriptional regulator